MTTIQATVNPRLLGKASRLFTGTLPGRIIEVLQNARRAKARNVQITNHDGIVTVRDDGRGVDDFAKLLDVGGSGWEEKLEASEDPAGVGLFCLAPREVTIRSSGQQASIAGEGWTGAAVEVRPDPHPLPGRRREIKARAGTELSFPDEAWDSNTVNPLAVFTGLHVSVDGEACPSERFIRGQAALHPELGCRIQVVPVSELSTWHRTAASLREYGTNVLVNFHGQVISFNYRPVSWHDLCFLVDMTGQPTGIRLMLPARTCLVENEALAQLKAALELEAFKYVQQLGRHRLPYMEYLRARELGIELPEAEPCFRVGMLPRDMSPQPVEVSMPKGHRLSQCYRLAQSRDGNESDEANAHLLAALGQLDRPLVPLEIAREYDGYAWAALPTIGRVEVTAGKVLAESWVGSGNLYCVESLQITVHCSDGRVFRAPVCMAIKPRGDKEERQWYEDSEVYVTPEAQRRLSDEQVWYHLGGYSDDGDSYDTQSGEFSQQLDAFWLQMAGPDEPMRRKLVDCLAELKSWKSVLIQSDGRVTIRLEDGSEKALLPRDSAAAEEVES